MYTEKGYLIFFHFPIMQNRKLILDRAMHQSHDFCSELNLQGFTKSARCGYLYLIKGNEK
jgi:hypothetical protein